MAKKIAGYVKLQVPAGAANPSPPIGPALGQRGLNIMEFCTAFNAKTAQMEKGTPIPVVITAFQDRSFTFEMRQPPVTYFLKRAAGLKLGKKPASGHKTTGKGTFVGNVSEAQLREQKIGLLPQNLLEAIEALAGDEVVKAGLGTELSNEFIKLKRMEWTEYARHVSDWETQRYLEFF